MNRVERERRIQALKKEVEAHLPAMAGLCTSPDTPTTIIFSQHAFAADFQVHEYLLLGMVIKYIGLSGREIMICGSSR